MAGKRTCPNCGKAFQPWRAQRFCSERCRKAVENRRLRGSEPGKGNDTSDPLTASSLASTPDGIASMAGLSDATVDRPLVWLASNEVTHKLVHEGRDRALGWAMLIEGRGWFGRVRDDRGHWSFGPSTLNRARLAVEAWLRREPFDKIGDERTWRGDCGALLCGASLYSNDDAPLSEAA
jgi:hypothetical protein